MMDLEREHLKKKSEKELLDDIFSNKSEESGTYDFPDRYEEQIEEETAADDMIIDFSEDAETEILKKEEKEDTETENTEKDKEAEKHSAETEAQAEKDKEQEEKEKDKAVVFIDFSERPDGKGEEQEKDLEELLDYEHTEHSEKDEDEKKGTDKKIPWWVYYLLVALGIAAAVLIILLVI